MLCVWIKLTKTNFWGIKILNLLLLLYMWAINNCFNFQTVAYTVRNKHYLIQKAVDLLMREKREKLVITKSVRELLFDGYQDPLIDLIRKMNNTGFQIPFDKFGWFYSVSIIIIWNDYFISQNKLLTKKNTNI